MNTFKVLICLIYLTGIFGLMLVKRPMECSSYFRRAVFDDSLPRTIKQISKSGCSYSNSFQLNDLSWNDTICILTYEVLSNELQLRLEKKCHAAFIKAMEEGMTLAWGKAWGCYKKVVREKITPFYTIDRYLPNIEASQSLVTLAQNCNVALFSRNATFEAKCKMNKYGGYDWEVDEVGGCYIPGFENPSILHIKKLSDSLRDAGEVKCQSIFMMLYGAIKKSLFKSDTKSLALRKVIQFIHFWKRFCYNLPLREKLILRNDIFMAMTVFIHEVFKTDPIKTVYYHEFYQVLMWMTQLLNEHAQSCKGPYASSQWITSEIAVFRFSIDDMLSAEHNFIPNGTNVPPNEITLNFKVQRSVQLESIHVTCFNLKVPNLYVEMRHLKPVSDVCIFGGINAMTFSTEMKTPNGFSIRFQFKKEIIYINKTFACLLIILHSNNINGISTKSCETQQSNKYVICTCTSYGVVLLSEVCKQFNNLKTEIGGFFIFEKFALLLFGLTILGCLILIICSSSKFLRKAFRSHQNRNCQKFRDFSIVILIFNFGVIYSLKEALSKCSDSRKCSTAGAAILAWKYSYMGLQFCYTLILVLSNRTHKLGQMMRNLTFICIGIFFLTRTIVQQVMKNSFINYVCMPIHIDYLIFLPQGIMVITNLICLILHIWKHGRRYLEEWLGCMLFVITNIIMIFIRIVNLIEDSETESSLFYKDYLMITGLIHFTVIVYQVFLKPTMIVFYSRLYKVLIRKRNLDDVIVQQLSSGFMNFFMFGVDEEKRPGSQTRSSRTTSGTTSGTTSQTTDSEFSSGVRYSSKKPSSASDNNKIN